MNRAGSNETDTAAPSLTAQLTARPFYRADQLKPWALDNHAVMLAGAEDLPDLSAQSKRALRT